MDLNTLWYTVTVGRLLCLQKTSLCITAAQVEGKIDIFDISIKVIDIFLFY